MKDMITFHHKGDFKKTNNFLKKLKQLRIEKTLEKYGQIGVDALSRETPKDTGITAASWGYQIHKSEGSVSIEWTNSSQNKGIPIVVLIINDHGTRNGGFVKGRDFITPTLQPIFDQIAEEVWGEVRKA